MNSYLKFTKNLKKITSNSNFTMLNAINNKSYCNNTNNLFLKSCFSKFNFSSKTKKGGLSSLIDKLDLKLEDDASNPFLKTSTPQKFPYLPINDHPLVPGYARFLPITMKLGDQIQEILEKNENTKFVISVSKDKKTNNNFSQIKQLLEQVNYIPDVTDKEQVFEVGCVCEIKIADQKETGKAALIMPLTICHIEDFTIPPKPQELAEVSAKVFVEEYLNEERLEEIEDKEVLMKFQFLKKLFEKIARSSKDESFIRLLASLNQNFNVEYLNEMIWMTLSCLALPKFFHKYGFLSSEISLEKIQEILETQNIFERLEAVIKLFSDFTNKVDLWEKLEDEYDHSTERKKINEKLQSIYQNLKTMFESDKDEKNIQIERFKKNMEGKNPPEHIMKIFKEELERFLSMDKHSMESNIIRNYLDILTGLPYGIYSKENFNLKNARKILEETHYGMESVKQRVLECIAVAKLKGKVAGKILCFAGPPGVGKTSIAESIAKALNREFYRVALGGDRDTSSLKGFRKTYVGAMPGKIINALKKTGTENPVILLDEIDKLSGRNHQGDPSSVLLEVLDPEQNHSFIDDYLDAPIDLSKVFFLCTANDLSYVPQPLLDRLEIIDVSGYTTNEKKFIYENHLMPKAVKLAGLDDKSHFNHVDFKVTEEAIDKLIGDYCRESGIRSLQRFTNRIFEKIAYKIVHEHIIEIEEEEKQENNNKNNETQPTNTENISSTINTPTDSNSNKENKILIEVNKENLKQYIGPAHFSSKRIYDKTPKGVSIGLGFNTYGGTIMYIEANKANYSEKNNQEKIIITGNVGKVMHESCNIAVSFAKNFLSSKNFSNFFEENAVHLHFIEGAIAKDGPSAGIAITTALLSLALDKPMVNDLAMTGEISLLGKVLPIGGVKEKVMAGKREGMRKIIVPMKNKDDVLELPEYIKEGMEFYYVEDYQEVFELCFGEKGERRE